MTQRMRSNNTTLIAIRMNNEIYDKMEEIRAMTGDSRTYFIEQAVTFKLGRIVEEVDKEVKNEV